MKEFIIIDDKKFIRYWETPEPRAGKRGEGTHRKWFESAKLAEIKTECLNEITNEAWDATGIKRPSEMSGKSMYDPRAHFFREARKGIFLPDDVSERIEFIKVDTKTYISRMAVMTHPENMFIKEFAILKPFREESPKKEDLNAMEFSEWVTWKAFYTVTDGKLMYHYPKEKGQGADVRTHTYQYDIKDLYEIFKNWKQLTSKT